MFLYWCHCFIFWNIHIAFHYICSLSNIQIIYIHTDFNLIYLSLGGYVLLFDYGSGLLSSLSIFTIFIFCVDMHLYSNITSHCQFIKVNNCYTFLASERNRKRQCLCPSLLSMSWPCIFFGLIVLLRQHLYFSLRPTFLLFCMCSFVLSMCLTCSLT